MKVIESRRLKKIIRMAGNILMLLSGVYILLFIVHAGVDWKRYLSVKHLIFIVLAGAFNSTGILLLAAAWRENLHIFSEQIPEFRLIAGVYSKANLARYIPGNVVHIATRNILGAQYGIKQLTMLISSAFEIGLQVITGIFLVALLLFPILRQAFGTYVRGWLPWIAAGAAAAFGTAIFLARGRLERFCTRFLWLSLLYCLLFEVVNLVSFWFVLNLFKATAPFSVSRELGGFYMASWLVGMVTPGAPGGMGIREYILLKLSGNRLDKEMVVIIMIFMRIVTIIGDISAYLMSVVIERKIKK